MTSAPRYERLESNQENNNVPSAVPERQDYFDSEPPDLTLRNSTPIQHTSNDYAVPLTDIPRRHTFRRQATDSSVPVSDPLSQASPTSPPDASRKSSSKFATWRNLKSVSSFNVPHIAAPYEHEPPRYRTNSTYRTEKDFDYKTQRKALFISSFSQWLFTAIICGSLAGVLVSYDRRDFLTTDDKHIFNALVTFLSIILGINLASSLRDYASMLRWRLLASGYRSLQEFDLVLACDSPKKVIRLLWIGRRKVYPYITRTQILAALWLFVNLAAQILVALTGLTYSLDQSDDFVSTKPGLVSVANLSTILESQNISSPTKWTQMAAAHSFGVQGQDYDCKADVEPDKQTWKQTTYTDGSGSYWLYRFTDWNPSNSLITLVSGRTVNATAACASYEVVQGIYGNSTNITYTDRGKNIIFDAQDASPGTVVYISDPAENCGPRCARIRAVQFADGDSVDTATFFDCNNTVHQVQEEWGPRGDRAFILADEQAFFWAGAIASTGFYTNEATISYQLYSTGSPWSPPFDMDESDMQAQLSSFSMNGIAALDDHGMRINVTGNQPSYALAATVEWKWAAAVLGVIPVLQFLALVAVIAWANKAVIKDDSHLSTARLLRPIVDRLGPHGCMLTGDEIAKELGNVRVAYGYRDPSGDDASKVRHIDIIEEKEGYRIQRSFPPDTYDGQSQAGEVRKRRRRMSSSL
ncbi:MAG: hypothetical protein Q9160_000905 [Pyrenula sp. 1 TL-2023]